MYCNIGSFFMHNELNCSYTQVMHVHIIHCSLHQLWTVVVYLIHPTAKLFTLLKQLLDRQQITVATQATTWLEGLPAFVKKQNYGLGMNPPVNVCLCCKYTVCKTFCCDWLSSKELNSSHMYA